MGKNIGGTFGMPMEWNRQTNELDFYCQKLDGEPAPNDDLDIQILWLLMLEDKGIINDSKIFGEYFNEFMIFTHAEYGTAKTNLRAGLQPPVSGTHNNCFKDSCGSFIRSEIWACLFPGMPELAAEYAIKDSMVDHGDGLGTYAEVFAAALESIAFYETDKDILVEAALSFLPDGNELKKALENTVCKVRNHTGREAFRRYIMENYIGHREWHYVSPEDEEKGYGEGPMGYDVVSNMMIIVYSFMSQESFDDMMSTAVYFGEDTDCTCGTIASIYGIMQGIEAIPDRWKNAIGNQIVTVSLDPFRFMGRIPRTVDEMRDRLNAIREKAYSHYNVDESAVLERAVQKSWNAKKAFLNEYEELHMVRYNFPYLNVRVDYMGEPVIRAGEPKKMRLCLSNTGAFTSSDRVNVYIYSRDGHILPSPEFHIFLTMPHMGDGIKEIEFQVLMEKVQGINRFVAEFIYEENKKSQVMEVPFVLLAEQGVTCPVIWEKVANPYTPNMPRI